MVWKREAGFDRIETIAEIHEHHFPAGFHLEPLYTKLYIPNWPHTPEEHTLEMRVNVKRLRMEIVLLQLAPASQCDSSPQRLPAVDMGSDECGVSGAESQSTEGEDFVLFKPVPMDFWTFAQVRNRRLLFCFNQTSE